MKSARTKTFTLTMVIALLILCCVIYLAYGHYLRKNGVLGYLENTGYSPSDIREIQVEYSFPKIISRGNPWSISVTFQDEPSAAYTYIYDGGNVSQGAGFKWETDNKEFQHME